MRKTFNVEDFKQEVNLVLTGSEGGSPEQRAFRQGCINTLESILFATGNYRGFKFLSYDDMIANQGQPGINTFDSLPEDEEWKRFDNTDKTRVRYL